MLEATTSPFLTTTPMNNAQNGQFQTQIQSSNPRIPFSWQQQGVPWPQMPRALMEEFEAKN
jgi:hypothetical protein